MFRYNTIDMSFCTNAFTQLEIAKGEVYAEVTVKECNYGMVTYFDGTDPI